MTLREISRLNSRDSCEVVQSHFALYLQTFALELNSFERDHTLQRSKDSVGFILLSLSSPLLLYELLTQVTILKFDCLIFKCKQFMNSVYLFFFIIILV